MLLTLLSPPLHSFQLSLTSPSKTFTTTYYYDVITSIPALISHHTTTSTTKTKDDNAFQPYLL